MGRITKFSMLGLGQPVFSLLPWMGAAALFGWKRRPWVERVALLFEEERARRAVLSFLRGHPFLESGLCPRTLQRAPEQVRYRSHVYDSVMICGGAMLFGVVSSASSTVRVPRFELHSSAVEPYIKKTKAAATYTQTQYN